MLTDAFLVSRHQVFERRAITVKMDEHGAFVWEFRVFVLKLRQPCGGYDYRREESNCRFAHK